MAAVALDHLEDFFLLVLFPEDLRIAVRAVAAGIDLVGLRRSPCPGRGSRCRRPSTRLEFAVRTPRPLRVARADDELARARLLVAQQAAAVLHHRARRACRRCDGTGGNSARAASRRRLRARPCPGRARARCGPSNPTRSRTPATMRLPLSVSFASSEPMPSAVKKRKPKFDALAAVGEARRVRRAPDKDSDAARSHGTAEGNRGVDLNGLGFAGGERDRHITAPHASCRRG